MFKQKKLSLGARFGLSVASFFLGSFAVLLRPRHRTGGRCADHHL